MCRKENARKCEYVQSMRRNFDDEWRRGRRNVTKSHNAAAVVRRWPSEDAHPSPRTEVKRQGSKKALGSWASRAGRGRQAVEQRKLARH